MRFLTLLLVVAALTHSVLALPRPAQSSRSISNKLVRRQGWSDDGVWANDDDDVAWPEVQDESEEPIAHEDLLEANQDEEEQIETAQDDEDLIEASQDDDEVIETNQDDPIEASQVDGLIETNQDDEDLIEPSQTEESKFFDYEIVPSLTQEFQWSWPTPFDLSTDVPSPTSLLDVLPTNVPTPEEIASIIQQYVKPTEVLDIISDVPFPTSFPVDQLPSMINAIPTPLSDEIQSMINAIPTPLSDEIQSMILAIPTPLSDEIQSMINAIPTPLSDEIQSMINAIPSPLEEPDLPSVPTPILEDVGINVMPLPTEVPVLDDDEPVDTELKRLADSTEASAVESAPVEEVMDNSVSQKIGWASMAALALAAVAFFIVNMNKRKSKFRRRSVYREVPEVREVIEMENPTNP